jgi:hypothetical protein
MSAADLIYLVEITAYDSALAGTRVLRFASGLGKMTRPTETPANAWFEPRLKQPITFRRTMFSAARVTGASSVGAGAIVLNNTDQGLASLRDLGIDGRDVVVRVGPQDAPYPEGYTTILTGAAEQAEVGATEVTIRLRDRLEILRQPLQSNFYAGTNVLPSGAEGTADDIKGQRKPLLFGFRFHIEPVLVNTAKLIYQIHDGSNSGVGAAFDRGVPISTGFMNYATLADLEAATVAAGTYVTCHSRGLLRLGSAPAGRLTVNATGSNVPAYTNKVAGIVRQILVNHCGVDVADLDDASFTALTASAAQSTGEYFTGEITRQAAIDFFLGSIGAWLVPTRLGKWQVGQLLAPSGTPAFGFGDPDILALDTQATRDAGGGIPVWQVRLRGTRYSPAAWADLAGSLSDADRNRLSQEWREGIATDAAVKTKHLLSQEMQADTALYFQSELNAEAARRLALHKVRRDYVRARLVLTQASAAVDLGDVVRLVTPRLGYGAGRDFRVVGIEADGKRRELILDLWG